MDLKGTKRGMRLLRKTQLLLQTHKEQTDNSWKTGKITEQALHKTNI